MAIVKFFILIDFQNLTFHDYFHRKLNKQEVYCQRGDLKIYVNMYRYECTLGQHPESQLDF